MSVQAFAAKRAIVDRVAALATTDSGLIAMAFTVAYNWTGDQTRRCAYSGAAHFTRTEGAGEYGVLAVEVDTISLYIRAYQPGDDLRGTETDVEYIATTIENDLSNNPKLAGTLTWTSVIQGDVDHTMSTNPEPAVICALRLLMTVQGYT